MGKTAPEKDILEEAGIDLTEASGMRKLTISLEKDRTGVDAEQFTYPGDIIIKEKLAGSASIAFAESTNFFPLGRFSKFERKDGFEKFYIQNEPQPGKELVIHVGGQSETDVTGSTSTNQIVDTEDAVIDPAARSGWENFEHEQDTGTANTDTQLNSGSSLAIPHEAEISIKALGNNAGPVYIGKPGVTDSSGYPLSPGEELSLEVRDVSYIAFYPVNDGDGVAWIVETE